MAVVVRPGRRTVQATDRYRRARPGRHHHRVRRTSYWLWLPASAPWRRTQIDPESWRSLFTRAIAWTGSTYASGGPRVTKFTCECGARTRSTRRGHSPLSSVVRPSWGSMNQARAIRSRSRRCPRSTRLQRTWVRSPCVKPANSRRRSVRSRRGHCAGATLEFDFERGSAERACAQARSRGVCTTDL